MNKPYNTFDFIIFNTIQYYILIHNQMMMDHINQRKMHLNSHINLFYIHYHHIIHI